MEDHMARTHAGLGSGARLTDDVSTRVLARVYPASLLGDLWEVHHCHRRRERCFPATAVA
jgi:hypothetical protein